MVNFNLADSRYEGVFGNFEHISRLRAHNKTREEEERLTSIDAPIHGQNISRVSKNSTSVLATSLNELRTCSLV